VTKGSIEGTKTMVIALGGNAIIPLGKSGTIEEQIETTDITMVHMAALIKAGHQIVVTHGNGPVVGKIFIRSEMAKAQIPPI